MTRLSVLFLGSGDAFSAGGRGQSGCLLRGTSTSVLLDCGATTLAALKCAALRSGEISTILISHFHGDHFAGLPFVILDGIFIERRDRPLYIAGPPGIRERTEALLWATYRGIAAEPLPIPVVYVEINPGQTCRIGETTVEPFRVPHQGTDISLGFRVTFEGKKILYSGDTGWTDDLVEYSKGTDLFICECSCFDTRVPSHLDYVRIHENLGRFGTRRLILTHLSAETLSHSAEIDIELAHDGLVLDL